METTVEGLGFKKKPKANANYCLGFRRNRKTNANYCLGLRV